MDIKKPRERGLVREHFFQGTDQSLQNLITFRKTLTFCYSQFFKLSFRSENLDFYKLSF